VHDPLKHCGPNAGSGSALWATVQILVLGFGPKHGTRFKLDPTVSTGLFIHMHMDVYPHARDCVLFTWLCILLP
jgi:hypothetical protein